MNTGNLSRIFFFGAILMVFIFSSLASGGPSLYLAGSAFDPGKDRLARQEDNQSSYLIVQFDGPIQETWKEKLKAAGAEILDYIPDFAFIIRMAPQKRAGLENLSHIRWVGSYQPQYRTSPQLAQISRRKGALVEVVIILFPGVDPEALEQNISSQGGSILARTRSSWKTRIRALVSPKNISEIATLNGVKWVEPAPQWILNNDQARDIIEVSTPWEGPGLYGSGQIIGVADSGIDRGTNGIGYLHEDFLDAAGTSPRVLKIAHLSTATSDIVGHGTHVAGSIIGNGKLSGSNPTTHFFPSGSYAGIAPDASLVVQNVSDAGGGLGGIPDDLNVLFTQALGGGARVHNNSWGSALDKSYSSYSVDVDEFAWDNQEFVIVFSAGNSGVDTQDDGVIDLGSVMAPATAKNCITVGASENYRPDGSDPTPAYNDTYGWFWPTYYPSTPISSDHVSNHPEGMAAFSSRGSSFSGRYKPEIVAPGTNVISTRSHAIDLSTPVLWGPGGLAAELQEWYTFSGGTSMSAPLVTGAAALVRQFYGTNFNHHTASSALVKATLLAWARDISPGQYGSGSDQEIPPSPRPNNVEGWGRLDLSTCDTTGELEDFYYFQVAPGLSTGSIDSYTIKLGTSLKDLCVTLAWTDYPGSAPTSGGLVNDLDLEVIGPSGTSYYPNQAIAIEGLAYDEWIPTSDTTIPGSQVFPGVVTAVRLTPSHYPATLNSGSFLVGSLENQVYPVRGKFFVYSGDASGPKTKIWSSERDVNWGATWYQVDFSPLNLTINSGDFFLGVSPVDEEFVWGIDEDPLTISNRTWQYIPGSSWVNLNVYDALIRGSVSYPTTRDRTNNIETVSLSLPEPGDYQLKVRGYNIPSGPQPYALVATRPAWSGEDFPSQLVIDSGDYDGDGTADLAYFRGAKKYWSVRGITSFYFGDYGDIPASGDYDGDGTAEAAIFRYSTGLWKIRGISNFYFGQQGMVPVPADYNGDGKTDAALFRDSDGLWKIRGLSVFYYGKDGDQPIPGNYEGSPSGQVRAAYFRPSTGYWGIRDYSGFYFGKSGDIAVPADYDGIPGLDLAWFRPQKRLWSMFGYTKFYFGTEEAKPISADYDGDGCSDYAYFDQDKGLWKIRSLTRVYFGKSGDLPVTR